MNDKFFIIAQVLSLIALGANVASIQLSKRQQIFKLWIIAGIFFTLSFIFLGAYAGAVSCFIALAQTIISYYLQQKGKEFPFYLTIIFIIISLISGALTYKNYYDILPILGAITYILSIVQKKENRIRIITVINLLLWIFYNFLVGAYIAFVSDIIFFVSTLAAVIRFDILKQK